MKLADKIRATFRLLIGGALLILVIVPGTLFVLSAVSEVPSFLPYVLWPLLYLLYAVAVIGSASSGELFKRK